MGNVDVTRNIVTYDGAGKVIEVVPVPPSDPSDSTFPKLIEALGGKEAFEKLPVLDLGEYTGCTGYIDFLEVEDVAAPLMRGMDSHGRPFVTFRLKIGEEVGVEVAFRRYTTGRAWVSGDNGDIPKTLCTSAMNAGDLDWIRRLLAGEEVGARHYTSCENKNLEGRLQEISEKGGRVVSNKEYHGWTDVEYELGRVELV